MARTLSTSLTLHLTQCIGLGCFGLGCAVLVCVGLSACGSDTPSATVDGGAGADGGVRTDAGTLPTYACALTDFTAPSAPPQTPYFVDVSAAAGALEATRGFGRVLVVDVDSDGHDDLVGTPTHDGPHSIPADDFAKVVLRARGDGTFEDWTASSGLAAMRAGLMVFADVDDDGDQDLYAGTIEAQGLGDRGIWRNDATGRFTRAGESGLALESLACGARTCWPAQIGATFFDVDRDGDLDLYTGGWFWSDGETSTRYSPPPADRLYQNRGDGSFDSLNLPFHAHPRSGITAPRFGRAAMGVSAGDYDNDGDLDVFVANYGVGRPALVLPSGRTCEPPRYWDQNMLWRNDAGTLVDVGELTGVAATLRGPSGIVDEPTLRIGDECPEDVRGDYLAPIGGNSFTSQFADFDNDGDLDLIVGSISHSDYLQSDPTVIFVNGGPPDYRFTALQTELGLRYREDEKHPSFVDIDADGLLDLAITGFRDPAENTLDVYRQTPTHTFERQSTAVSGVDDQAQESIAWLDYDGDGDLDLYIAEESDEGRLYENRAANNAHVLVIRLEALGPRDATGARVSVHTSAGRQLRELTSGNGHYNPQPSRALYFGLGGDSCAGEVRVRWPDGSEESLGAVAADQTLTIVQGASVSATSLTR